MLSIMEVLEKKKYPYYSSPNPNIYLLITNEHISRAFYQGTRHPFNKLAFNNIKNHLKKMS